MLTSGGTRSDSPYLKSRELTFPAKAALKRRYGMRSMTSSVQPTSAIAGCRMSNMPSLRLNEQRSPQHCKAHDAAGDERRADGDRDGEKRLAPPDRAEHHGKGRQARHVEREEREQRHHLRRIQEVADLQGSEGLEDHEQ